MAEPAELEVRIIVSAPLLFAGPGQMRRHGVDRIGPAPDHAASSNHDFYLHDGFRDYIYDINNRPRAPDSPHVIGGGKYVLAPETEAPTRRS
jgi:hypothetical protein